MLKLLYIVYLYYIAPAVVGIAVVVVGGLQTPQVNSQYLRNILQKRRARNTSQLSFS